MSRHENVSCDSCMKTNFKGRRYKCLICFDYDLCAACYEAGTTTARHLENHAMQCILTRLDFDLFYNEERIGPDNPQSFTCPHCDDKGFTEIKLMAHLNSKHCSSVTQVICPMCAASPGGDPNYMTDNLLTHIQMEHRDREPFEQDPISLLRGPRRQGAIRGGRARAPRSYSQALTSSSNPPSNPPSNTLLIRDPVDPIAELLSHLSGVHNRMRANSQQLREIQILSNHDRLLREQLQMLSRGEARAADVLSPRPFTGTSPYPDRRTTNEQPIANSGSTARSASSISDSLLSRFTAVKNPTESESIKNEALAAANSLFTQELLLSTLVTRKPTTSDGAPGPPSPNPGVDDLKQNTS